MLSLLARLNLVALIFFAYLTYSLSSPTPNSLQLSPPPAQAQNSTCSVGNNLAVPFGKSGEDYSEAQYTLALYTGPESEAAIIKTINGTSQTVIIRLGAGKEAPGPSAPIYAQSLNSIAAGVNGKNFLATAGHNEPNCAEYITLAQEADYVRTVASSITASNIQLITGQIDFYCGNWQQLGRASPEQYIKTLTQIPGIKGLALPFYITPGTPNANSTVALFNQFADSTNLPIFITESGPLLDDSFEEFAEAVPQALAHPNIVTMLLFNSHGLNPDGAFAYTQPFWNPDCREAFRTSCNNPQTVIEACQLQISVCEIPHSCTCFCQGTPHAPCASTPINDCSIPYDAEDFTDPDLPTASEEDKDIIRDLSNYLSQFLARAVIGNGNEYSLRGIVNNAEACEEGSPTIDWCREEEGGAEVTLITDEIIINTITDASDADTNKREYITGFYQVPDASNKETLGTNIKLAPQKDWWVRMAEVQDLKSTCFSMAQSGTDPIIDYIDHDFWGSVRCINYVEFSCSPNCPGGNNTEQDVFTGPLSSCVDDPGSPECLDDYDNLPSEIRENVKNLSNIPVATFPFIVASDQTDPESGDSEEDTSIIGGVIDAILSFFTNILYTEDAAKLRSTYASFPVTAGQDTAIASKITSDYLTPASRQTSPQQPSSVNISNFDPSKPFDLIHLPLDLRTTERQAFDSRFVTLQAFTNQNVGTCLDAAREADRTTNEESKSLTKKTKQFNAPEGDPANLKLAIDVKGTSYDIQNFLKCLIVPHTLVDADDNAVNILSLLTPKSKHSSIVDPAKKTKLELATGTIELPENEELEPIREPPCVPGARDPITDECLEREIVATQGHQAPVKDASLVRPRDSSQDTTDHTPGGSLLRALKDLVFQYLLPASKPGCLPTDATYYECLTRQGSGSRRTRPITPISTCTISGGPEIKSSSLQSVLATSAQNQNVPIGILLAVLQNENCRSNTLYNGESASICVKDESFLAPYLNPTTPYPHTAGCPDGNRTSGTGVFQFQTSLWPSFRPSPSSHICSINASADAAAKYLAQTAPSSGNWQVQDVQKAISLWVAGRDVGCNPDIEDLPSEWSQATKELVRDVLPSYCQLAVNYFNSSSSTCN